MDLIKYVIRHMSEKNLIHQLFDQLKIDYRASDGYEKLSNRIETNDSSGLTLDFLRSFFRSHRPPAPKELHLENLKSGLLKNHGWHGARPSMLHLSMQDRVRDCVQGKIALEDLIEIGSNIMKHEYFMVATHDLCETTIIESFSDVIPPTRAKSISDFIFKGMPFDLKNTNYFNGYDKKFVNANKALILNRLLEGADVERLRKQAKKTINDWGLNRFFVMVEDQERWQTDPEGVLNELVDEAKKLKAPIKVDIQGIDVHCHLIAI